MTAADRSAGSNGYEYDVVVLGGGPGGYVAAIRAAQLGARTAVVEKGQLGGTCLNVGCIPTKAVISSVALYQSMHNASAFGLSADNISYDIGGIVSGAKGVVKQLVSGVGILLKKNKIEHIRGFGSFADAHTIKVTGPDGERTITTANTIVATGSTPAIPPIEGLTDFGKVWTSDDAVFADHVPEKLVVVGGGAIGLEFGYIFNGLGSKVTIVEMLPQILPAADKDASAELARHLKKQGIDIRPNTMVARLSPGKGKKSGKALLKSEGKEEEVEADVVLLAAGRVPLSEGLHLESLGVKMNRTAIAVDEYLRTSVPGIYAIGDVIGEPLLAHSASAEGEAAVENIMGGSAKVNYRAMPAAVYTHPELASVGLSEKQAREQYSDVVTGKFPFSINGRALGEREPEGMVKFVVSEKHGEILGVSIVGPHASDLIAECATAIASELTIDELIHSVHAHPTLSEVVFEAACDVRGRCVHKA